MSLRSARSNIKKTEHSTRIYRIWRFFRLNMAKKNCKKTAWLVWNVFYGFRSAIAKRDISSPLHFTNLPNFKHVQIVSTLLHFQVDFSKLAVDFINDDVTRLLGELLVDGEAETKSFVLICIFRPRSHFNQPRPGNISLFPLHIISWNPLHQLLHVTKSSAGCDKNSWRRFFTGSNFLPGRNSPVLRIRCMLFCHPLFITWTGLVSKLLC